MENNQDDKHDEFEPEEVGDFQGPKSIPGKKSLFQKAIAMILKLWDGLKSLLSKKSTKLSDKLKLSDNLRVIMQKHGPKILIGVAVVIVLLNPNPSLPWKKLYRIKKKPKELPSRSRDSRLAGSIMKIL
jgi:hypothetical protein